MSPDQLERLVAAVKTNCDIADARHAGDLTLCIYLLQMRELHRWERGIALDGSLEQSQVGDWIAAREALWSTLADRDFIPLPLGQPGDSIDPFDVAAVDRLLRPQGMLYGAGLAGPDRPLFFVAELHAQTWRVGLPVLTAGRELARTLQAPLAALGRYGAQDTIVIRRESLARWCWEKYEVYNSHRKTDTPLHAVIEIHGQGPDFAANLPLWLADLTELMVLHELGEHRAAALLGPEWGAMRLALRTRRAEVYTRALRDHLADLGLTLPTLLDRGADAALHFWYANFDGVREALFPQLKSGYADWRRGDGGQTLRRLCAQGAGHFEQLAREVLALHAQAGPGSTAAIQQVLTSPAAICPA